MQSDLQEVEHGPEGGALTMKGWNWKLQEGMDVFLVIIQIGSLNDKGNPHFHFVGGLPVIFPWCRCINVVHIQPPPRKSRGGPYHDIFFYINPFPCEVRCLKRNETPHSYPFVPTPCHCSTHTARAVISTTRTDTPSARVQRVAHGHSVTWWSSLLLNYFRLPIRAPSLIFKCDRNGGQQFDPWKIYWMCCAHSVSHIP